MFVHRLTWNVKDLDEAAAIAKDYWERFAPQHTVRVLTSWLYPDSALTVDIEFESLAAYEEFWRGHHASSSERAAWHSENDERMEAVFGEYDAQEMWEVR